MTEGIVEFKDWEKLDLRVGQIIFDPNGEYANENVQDNDTALKNIWKLQMLLTRQEVKNA